MIGARQAKSGDVSASKATGAHRSSAVVIALLLAACSAPDSSSLFSSVDSTASAAGAGAMAAADAGEAAATPMGAKDTEPPSAVSSAPAAGETPPGFGAALPVAGAPADATPMGADAAAADDAASSDPDPGAMSEPGADDPAPSVPEPVGVVVTDANQACSFPEDAPQAARLFSGQIQDGTCRINLDAPYETFWYPYQDRDTDSAVSQGARAPGCSEDTCSLRVQGPTLGADAFSVYGAGVGFPLDADGGAFDASGFSGIQYWARGVIEGTRGPGGASSPQTLRLKIVTTQNRLGDDFGMYCRIDPENWTLCRQTFAELARDGFASDPDPLVDVFAPDELVRVEFEFPLFRDAVGAVPTPVRFDLELAAVSFF